MRREADDYLMEDYDLTLSFQLFQPRRAGETSCCAIRSRYSDSFQLFQPRRAGETSCHRLHHAPMAVSNYSSLGGLVRRWT